MKKKKSAENTSDKKSKLKRVMQEINKKQGIDSVKFASSVEKKDRMSFGYKALDDLTGGGILCGNFTTIWGAKSSGKSSVAYKMIATAQAQGKSVAYLDVERSYDPEWATKFGVDTDQLIYIICNTAEEVLDNIITMCREKVIDLAVLDSIQGLTPRGENYAGKGEKEKSVEDDTLALLARKMSQFFRMATAPVANAKCAVLLIGQSRMDLGSFIKLEVLSGGNSLLHNSRLILKFRRGQGADAPIEKIKNEEGKTVTKKLGFDLVVRIDKAQLSGCTEGQEIHLPFLYEKGIVEDVGK